MKPLFRCTPLSSNLRSNNRDSREPGAKSSVPLLLAASLNDVSAASRADRPRYCPNSADPYRRRPTSFANRESSQFTAEHWRPCTAVALTP